MDFPRLLYALYADYWTKAKTKERLPSYTEFLERLSQASALEDVHKNNDLTEINF